MEIKSSELVKIIDACGKNGVSQFKSGDVEISFNGFVIQTESEYPKQVAAVHGNVLTDPNFKLQQDFELDNDDVEHLMITDPAEYEKRLMEGELEESESMVDNELA